MSDKNTRREDLPAKQNLLNMLPSDAEAPVVALSRNDVNPIRLLSAIQLEAVAYHRAVHQKSLGDGIVPVHK